MTIQTVSSPAPIQHIPRTLLNTIYTVVLNDHILVTLWVIRLVALLINKIPVANLVQTIIVYVNNVRIVYLRRTLCNTDTVVREVRAHHVLWLVVWHVLFLIAVRLHGRHIHTVPRHRSVLVYIERRRRCADAVLVNKADLLPI